MRRYRNRLDVDPATPVSRFMSLEAALLTLANSQLRFTRIDMFRDPFEGTVPQPEVDGQIPALIGANAAQAMMQQVAPHFPGMERPRRVFRDAFVALTERRLAKIRSAHASCWSLGEELEASMVADDLYGAPIRYRLYHEGPVFNDELDVFMHKRYGFRSEAEYRLLRFDEAQYRGLTAHQFDHGYGPPPPDPPPELPDYIPLDWAPRDAVTAIVVGPYGSDDYERRVRAGIAARAPGFEGLVELSVLSEGRYRRNI
jgi:hypothetical protein